MKRAAAFKTRLTFVMVCMFSVPSVLYAQSVTAYSSSSMWGTASSGNAVPGAGESAGAHYINGNVAGQVIAAKRGLLMNTGSNFSVTTIGSQSIISNTIAGDGNVLDVDAEQSSTNTGNVDADVEFNVSDVEQDVWNLSVGE